MKPVLSQLVLQLILQNPRSPECVALRRIYLELVETANWQTTKEPASFPNQSKPGKCLESGFATSFQEWCHYTNTNPNNARFNVKGNLPFKTTGPYLMNDPCPTKKTPFGLYNLLRFFVSSFCCSVLEPCDQKQRLLVVLEFGFEGLSNKPAFAGDWELSFMVKHGETRKTVGYQKAPTALQPPC